jgi:LacI family transcriptional regulator
MWEPINKSTLLDIARELNITPSTVSRALNGHSAISVSTKEAVHKIAKKLDYHPNKVASSLRLGKSRIIGVIIPSAEINFFGSVVHGIEKVANENDYNVLLYQSSELEEIEKKGVGTFLRSRVDGVLASISKETTNLAHFREIKRRGVPLVLFDRVDDDLEVPSVVIDDFNGAYKATQHLIDGGCKKVAHVTGPQHVAIFNKRLKGYKKAIEDNGLPLDEELIIAGQVTIESGYQCMMKLLNLESPPDGVFAVEDFTALGVMKALKEKGKKIPDEVSLIGFANEAFGEYITPSLSTVDQQTIKMGEAAAKLFFDLSVDGTFYKSAPQKVILEPVLVYRNTSLRT